MVRKQILKVRAFLRDTLLDKVKEVRNNHRLVLTLTYHPLFEFFIKITPEKRQHFSILGCLGVVIITTAELHSTKSELRFCAGSNPARGVSEIGDGKDL